MPLLAADPVKSEAQRRAMWAAREGRSTLGIPKSVGEKFVGPGHDAAPRRAAGVLITTDDGLGLFLRRGDQADHPGEWGIPGGGAEGAETPEQTARREAAEEIGFRLTEPMAPLHQATSPEGVDFVTYHQPVTSSLTPTINEEHSDYVWAPLDRPPQPLHPGVAATLAKLNGGQDVQRHHDDHENNEVRIDPWQWAGLIRLLGRGGGSYDAKWEESKHPRGQPENAGQFGPGGGGKKAERSEEPQPEFSRKEVVANRRAAAAKGGTGGGLVDGKTVAEWRKVYKQQGDPMLSAAFMRGMKGPEDKSPFATPAATTAWRRGAAGRAATSEKQPTKRERVAETAAWRREVAQRQAPVGGGFKAPPELVNEVKARAAGGGAGEPSDAYKEFVANAIGRPPAKRSALEKLALKTAFAEHERGGGGEPGGGIQKGDEVHIKPEWQDPGDKKYKWVAASAVENGRLDITPLGTNLTFPPIYTVEVGMLEGGEKAGPPDDFEKLKGEIAAAVAKPPERRTPREQALASGRQAFEAKQAEAARLNRDIPEGDPAREGRIAAGWKGGSPAEQGQIAARSEGSSTATARKIAAGVEGLAGKEIAPGVRVGEGKISEADIAEGAKIIERLRKMRGGQAHDEWFAFDRATARSYDKDGRLHVAATNISKSNVSPYLGREIPDWDKLGLDPDRTYKLLRDPAELAKAAPTFNNLPLLDRHVAVTADSYPGDLVIGSTGTDTQFAFPYLRNSLVVWKGDAIKDVNNETKKELSSAYRYRADMTPGVFQGEPYDGVMRDIIGNHVALVKEGRVGTDVVVGDAAPRQLKELINMSKTLLSRKATLAQGALAAFLLPRLAHDAKVDLAPILAGLTAENFKEQKAAVIAGIKKAVDGKLASDARPIDEDLVLAMDALQDIPVAENPLEAPPPGAPAGAPPLGGPLPEGSIDPNAGLPMALPPPPEKEVTDADPLAAGGEPPADPGAAPPAPEPQVDPAEQIIALLQGKVDEDTLAQVLAIVGGGAEAGDKQYNEIGGPELSGTAQSFTKPNPVRTISGGDQTTVTTRNSPTMQGTVTSGSPEAMFPASGRKPIGDAPPKDLRTDVTDKEKQAMDAKAIDTAVKTATDAVMKKQQGIREAERFVRPWVGELQMAHDSAEAVVRSALKTLAVDGVDEIKELLALKAILKAQPLPGAKKAEASVAMDAAQTKSYNERFPEAARIGNLG